jgi:hypothetical protein
MEKKTTDTMLLMRGLEARLIMGMLMIAIKETPNEVIPSGIDGLRVLVDDLLYLESFCKDTAMQQRFRLLLDHFQRVGLAVKNKGYYDDFLSKASIPNILALPVN